MKIVSLLLWNANRESWCAIYRTVAVLAMMEMN